MVLYLFYFIFHFILHMFCALSFKWWHQVLEMVLVDSAVLICIVASDLLFRLVWFCVMDKEWMMMRMWALSKIGGSSLMPFFSLLLLMPLLHFFFLLQLFLPRLISSTDERKTAQAHALISNVESDSSFSNSLLSASVYNVFNLCLSIVLFIISAAIVWGLSPMYPWSLWILLHWFWNGPLICFVLLVIFSVG